VLDSTHDGTFASQIVKKRQGRLREFDRPIALGLVGGYAELATGAILRPTP
jgi:hypothetical protein